MFYSEKALNDHPMFEYDDIYLTIVLAKVRSASLLFVAACLRISVERR